MEGMLNLNNTIILTGKLATPLACHYWIMAHHALE